MNIKDLTEYLSQYDSPYEPYTPEQMLPVIRKTLNALRNMPECRYVLKGSYSLSGYMNRESELFYIRDLYIFKELLKEYGIMEYERGGRNASFLIWKEKRYE